MFCGCCCLLVCFWPEFYQHFLPYLVDSPLPHPPGDAILSSSPKGPTTLQLLRCLDTACLLIAQCAPLSGVCGDKLIDRRFIGLKGGGGSLAHPQLVPSSHRVKETGSCWPDLFCLDTKMQSSSNTIWTVQRSLRHRTRLSFGRCSFFFEGMGVGAGEGWGGSVFPQRCHWPKSVVSQLLCPWESNWISGHKNAS